MLFLNRKRFEKEKSNLYMDENFPHLYGNYSGNPERVGRWRNIRGLCGTLEFYTSDGVNR